MFELWTAVMVFGKQSNNSSALAALSNSTASITQRHRTMLGGHLFGGVPVP